MRVRVCPNQFQDYVLAGKKGNGHKDSSALLPTSQQNVPGIMLTVRGNARSVLTAEYKLNFVAPSKGDRLTCRAEVLKPGRTLTVVEAKVTCRTEGAERLVAVALATIANLDRPKGS